MQCRPLSLIIMLLALAITLPACVTRYSGDLPGLAPVPPTAPAARVQYPFSVAVRPFEDSRSDEHNVTSGAATARIVSEYLRGTGMFTGANLRSAGTSGEPIVIVGNITALEWAEYTANSLASGGAASSDIVVRGTIGWKITDSTGTVLAGRDKTFEKKGARNLRQGASAQLSVLNKLYSEVYQELCDSILEDLRAREATLARIPAQAPAPPVQAAMPNAPSSAPVSLTATRPIAAAEPGWAMSPGMRPPESAVPPPGGSTARRDEKWRALLIGINSYRAPGFESLETPVNDVRELATILRENYGFEVSTLLEEEATVENANRALIDLAQTATSDENLLVYFAGHGTRDEGGVGSWLFHDSASAFGGMPNSLLKDRLREIRARRILLVADSCYSGSFVTRGDRLVEPVKNSKTITDKEKAAEVSALLLTNRRTSREAITSGNLHPVPDKGAGFCIDHSPFACGLADSLKNVPPRGVLSTRELYLNLYSKDLNQRKLAGQEVQGAGPQLGLFEGHDNGEFLFVRVR